MLPLMTCPIDHSFSLPFKLLSQDRVSDGTAYLRVLVRHDVRYVVLDDTLCDVVEEHANSDFMWLLPQLHIWNSLWSCCKLSSDKDGTQVLFDVVWRDRVVNILDLDLKPENRLGGKPNVYRTQDPETDEEVVAKFIHMPLQGVFEHIKKEAIMYQILECRQIAPHFVAHIEEGGRIIGFLTTYIFGEHPRRADYKMCQDTIEALHKEAGLVHGDLSDRNIIIEDGSAWFINFELAKLSVDDVERQHDYDTLKADMFGEA